ncbi:MAG: hypothetical protein ACI363_00605, partial [Phocaeicola plebeius]
FVASVVSRKRMQRYGFLRNLQVIAQTFFRKIAGNYVNHCITDILKDDIFFLYLCVMRMDIPYYIIYVGIDSFIAD